MRVCVLLCVLDAFVHVNKDVLCTCASVIVSIKCAIILCQALLYSFVSVCHSYTGFVCKCTCALYATEGHGMCSDTVVAIMSWSSL